jgi:hypothetical protein
VESSEECGHSIRFDAVGKAGRSIRVKENRPRTTAPHGLSHHERDRLTEGMDYLRRRGPCGAVVREHRGREVTRSGRRSSKADQTYKERHRATTASRRNAQGGHDDCV